MEEISRHLNHHVSAIPHNHFFKISFDRQYNTEINKKKKEGEGDEELKSTIHKNLNTAIVSPSILHLCCPNYAAQPVDWMCTFNNNNPAEKKKKKMRKKGIQGVSAIIIIIVMNE